MDMVNKYFYIYTFCFITGGVDYFTIYDSRKKKLHKFSQELFKIASKDFKTKPVSEILTEHNDSDRVVINDFINYLKDNHLGRFVKDLSRFPELEEQWDAPYKIKRCIIDIRNKEHDFQAIFSQLAVLLCPKIEIRVYRHIPLSEIKEILNIFNEYDFGVIFFVLPFYASFKEDFQQYASLISENYRIYFNVYGVPETEYDYLCDLKDDTISSAYNIRFCTKQISGREDCGEINPSNFHSFGIEEVMENKLFNSCLNRLISIDEDGFIRNCPSMNKHYGNIANTYLLDVYNNPSFRKYWTINNSLIEGCSDCELRIVCMNCRAYVKDSNNIFSHPLKCHYRK